MDSLRFPGQKTPRTLIHPTTFHTFFKFGKNIEQKTFLRKSLSLFSHNPSSFIFISITMHKLSGLDCLGAMVFNNFNRIQGRIVFVFHWFSVFCFQLNMDRICYRCWMDIVRSLLSPLLLRFWSCHTFFTQVAAIAASLYRPVCMGSI